MAEENNEVQLTEAELSNVKNSLATLCKKYITGSFFDKLVDTTGILQAKEILIGDLKNMIGRGTSAPAAKRFANAVMSARSTADVDTIMANYMLAGDGMKAGIGYNESTTDHIEAFRKFLSESRKNDGKKEEKQDEKKAGDCDKKPTEEEIAEAIEVVKQNGCTVEKINEDKDTSKADEQKKEPVAERELEEAISIIEACGKKAKKKCIDESEYRAEFTLDCKGICDPVGLRDLIDDAIATDNIDRSVADAISDIYTTDGAVKIVGDNSLIEDAATGEKIRSGIRSFLENAPGVEVEVGEDVIDNWEKVFKISESVEGNQNPDLKEICQ